MTDPRTKALADKYIGRDGGAPSPEENPASTHAEASWREHAETIHRFLRKRLKTDRLEANAAICALERIGDAIAMDEKRAKARGR